MRTVVHLVSGDETEQQTGLSIVRNLLDSEGDQIDDVAVVVQAGGIQAVVAGEDGEERVRELLGEGVPFRACRNTLDGRDMDEADLVDGVETVPEGAIEVTRLQSEEGYAYIRP